MQPILLEENPLVKCSMNMKNKRVLVTGGAVRIGSVICQAFASAGAEVVIHCNHSRREADALSASFGNNKKHMVVEADLSVEQQANALFEKIGKPIDILVNNASRYEPKSLIDGDINCSRLDFEVNFFSPLILMKNFYRQYNGEDGTIINVLDQEVGQPSIKSGSYGLSRKILMDATIAAAVEMAPQIRVNAIALGPVIPPPGREHWTMEKTLQTVPLKRKVEIVDIVSGCLFLAENRSMTGQILYLDCGQHLL